MAKIPLPTFKPEHLKTINATGYRWVDSDFLLRSTEYYRYMGRSSVWGNIPLFCKCRRARK